MSICPAKRVRLAPADPSQVTAVNRARANRIAHGSYSMPGANRNGRAGRVSATPGLLQSIRNKGLVPAQGIRGDATRPGASTQPSPCNEMSRGHRSARPVAGYRPETFFRPTRARTCRCTAMRAGYGRRDGTVLWAARKPQKPQAVPRRSNLRSPRRPPFATCPLSIALRSGTRYAAAIRRTRSSCSVLFSAPIVNASRSPRPSAKLSASSCLSSNWP